MKKLLSFIAIAAISSSVFAQNNVVKIKPVRLGLKQISLEYERVLVPKLSASINFTYQIPWELTQADIDGNYPELTGMSISPAVRFYPGMKETPRGFYLEGFFKYLNYGIGMDYDLDITLLLDPSAPAGIFGGSELFELDGTYKAVGGGISIGTQWLIGDHFSIDWKFLGVGIYSTTVSAEIAGSLPYDPAAVIGGVDYNPKWASAETELENELGDLPGSDALDVSSTDGANGAGSIEISATSLGIMPRMGLTFGWAF